MNSSCVEKIKKLLSLAQSDNANERDAALAKAQRIATENEVDLALLDLSDVGVVKEEELVEASIDVGARLDVHKKFVARIVKQVCNVELLYGWNCRNENGVYKRDQTVNFLGKKSDTEFAKWLYPFLLDEYVRRWNYERKAHDLPVSHRNTFFLGVKDGQEQKIAEERRAARTQSIARHVQASVASVSSSVEGGAGPGEPSQHDFVQAKTAELTQKYTLVVQGDESRRKDFLKKKYPSTRTMRSTRVSIRSHDTYSSGSAHGRAIGLNRPLNA